MLYSFDDVINWKGSFWVSIEKAMFAMHIAQHGLRFGEVKNAAV